MINVKLRIYLDTSVFSAYFDHRVTDRQIETEEFWRRLNQFEVSTSELAQQELEQTPDSDQKKKFQTLLDEVTVFPITDEMERLAQAYLKANVFTPVCTMMPCMLLRR